MTEIDGTQYSKKKIFLLWALVALPMFFLKFVASPLLNQIIPIHPGILYWCLMIVGMIWQFVLSVMLLKQELGVLTWEKLKERLWLKPPTHPKTGQIVKKAYWLVIPIILYSFFFEQFGLFDFVEKGLLKLLPIIADPSYTNIEALMAPEFRGAWYLLIIATISSLFNYVLGEELLFRGVLLPKMSGAFGKWDWVMNGVLFATYHLHKLAEIPLFIVGSIFYGFLNKRYKTFYPALIIHGIEAVPLFLFIILFLLNII